MKHGTEVGIRAGLEIYSDLIIDPVYAVVLVTVLPLRINPILLEWLIPKGISFTNLESFLVSTYSYIQIYTHVQKYIHIYMHMGNMAFYLSHLLW